LIKNYFTILILAFMFLANPLSLGAMDYQHKLELKNMKFSWTIEGDHINVMLSAKTTGWVSIGFDPESVMQGANIIIGTVEEGKLKVEDHFGNKKRGHKSDEALGGSNDILNSSGSEENGVTTISFTFPLDTGDKYDKAINPKGTGRVMLAYGTGKNSFKTRHRFRTVYEINYLTGENKKIK
jgi:hypothetical protein